MDRLDLAQLSHVRCEISETRAEGTHVLVLAFFGAYRDGSQGTPDATRMAAETRAALAAWRPDALVFDMRGHHRRPRLLGLAGGGRGGAAAARIVGATRGAAALRVSGVPCVVGSVALRRRRRGARVWCGAEG